MRKLICIAAAPLVLSLLMGAGEIYRWKDSNGVWHYSDQPQPGAELISKGRPAGPTPVANSAPPAAPAATDNDAAPPMPAVTPQVAQQVRQEAATAKAEQCKKLEAEYTQVIQARRLYKTDEKGNRVFLTDAELDAARLQTRSARDIACAP